MSTSTRLKGKEGLFLSLKNGTAAAFTTAGDDVKEWEITSDDRDDSDLTFFEAAAGAVKEYTLHLTAIVSFDTASLWMYLWSNPGAEVDFKLAPKGNSVAAAGKPIFSGTVNTGGKPEVRNEARTTNEGAEFEVELVASTDIALAVS
ncbi:hypothetical protein [uncultured Friedmanniella sp.]|uniref:hypothetical protein n=1 Tax=uncultured Friedmanniella sp. TaxID=335381 RepID=UPI0035CBF32E